MNDLWTGFIRQHSTVSIVALLLVISPAFSPLESGLFAQSTGDIVGTVLSLTDAQPIRQALVTVEGTSLRTLTNDDGRFQISGVASGTQVLVISDYFSGGQRIAVEVPVSGSVTVDVEYRLVPFALSEIIVSGASRIPQRVVEAPVAIDVVGRKEVRDYSATGQHPLVLQGLTGMDVAANGIHDFNVNTRGFNTDLSNRLLVLMDGRDLSIPFLGAQEWSTLSLPLEDMERVEVARGPGSALYGANAYNGVVNIITPLARQIVGTKMSLSGGGLGTIRGDVRTARVFGENDRFGLRANVGYYRSDDWHRARTNVGDLEAEYSAAVDTADFPVNTPAPGFEVRPLNGQSLSSVPGTATGTPDPVENYYGSARLDYYADGGGVGTIEGGAAKALNQLFMTNVGRFQVDHAWRPWARAAWADDRFYVMGWYSGRSSDQASLASGAPIGESSRFLHFEAQTNTTFFEDRTRLVVGGSYRNSFIDSRGTLVAPADDARTDWYSAGFAQLEFTLSPIVKLVAAGRVDGSNLYDTQLSPKGALVFTPAEEHSFRLSVGGAFQTPRMTNLFLNVPLGVPVDLTALETGMRAAFGAALDPVAAGELFTNSSAVPALGLGNSSLDVERVVSFEAGYRGEMRQRLQLTVDGYYSIVEDFVSALLPYANPTFGAWTAPSTIDPSIQPLLEDAVGAATGPASGLTRLADGTTAFVFSYGNAGRATEWGLEIGADVEVTPSVHLKASYGFFDYRVDQGVPTVPGDLIVPNTPAHRGSLQVRYSGPKFDAWSGINVKSSHDWVSGFFQGMVPSSQRIDAGVGYVLGSRVRVHATATNLLDQSVYHIYGGSIDRRRILFGVTGYM